MDANEKTLTLFTTRMRQLILLYKEKIQENKELYAMLEEQEVTINNLKEQLADARRDYDNVKMAKMLEVTDGDLEITKKKVASIIHDIDKCITLLSEK